MFKLLRFYFSSENIFGVKKWRCPKAPKSKEDQKALLFLLEKVYLPPFHCISALPSPIPLVVLWDQRARETVSVHQPHSESGTLPCTQTHQHCVKLILNKIHPVKKKERKKKKNGPETHTAFHGRFKNSSRLLRCHEVPFWTWSLWGRKE